MIIYNRYINNEDYTWYDSSNVIFSKLYDNAEANKTLKVVFKEGRTYLYKDVTADDYLAFKNDQSNGTALNKYIIKKYKGVRIADTDIDKLQELQERLLNEDKEISEEKVSNLTYHLNISSKTGQVQLLLNNKVIYNGIEGQISLFNLLKAMNINYSWSEVDEIVNESDEDSDEIKLD